MVIIQGVKIYDAGFDVISDVTGLPEEAAKAFKKIYEDSGLKVNQVRVELNKGGIK